MRTWLSELSELNASLEMRSLDDWAAKVKTPEGLSLRTKTRGGVVWLEEVGKDGYVIVQYPAPDPRSIIKADVKFLLERLQELEGRCAADAPSLADRWNRKAAARRFRRWLRENDRQLALTIPEDLHAAARKAIETGPDDTPEVDAIEKSILEGGEPLFNLQEYLKLRQQRPVLILSEQLPSAIYELFSEACEAWCHSLDRAAIVVCRLLMEELLEDVATKHNKLAIPAQPSERRLASLLNATQGLLSSRAREDTKFVREAGNRAVHSTELSHTGVLESTVRVIEEIVNRHLLSPHQPPSSAD